MQEIFKARMGAFREAIAGLVADAAEVKGKIQRNEPDYSYPPEKTGEMIANITLAYRHLEDAAMRFGKAIQAADSGVSPLGGPDTPKA